jgi:uncharacterized protein YkwD
LRKIAAVALALPVVVFMYLSRLVRRTPDPTQPAELQGGSRPIQVHPARPAHRVDQARRASLLGSLLSRRGFSVGKSGALQLSGVGAAVVIVVGILLVGLPVKTAEGVAPETFAPLAPQANVLRDNANLSLDSPFQIQFTKPMNESSVESAISLTPRVDTSFRWDATDQTLSLLPASHWEPSTTYVLDVAGSATDLEGLNLAEPIHNSFQTGDLTAGQITATDALNGQVAPNTSFQVTFTRPVKLATVMSRFGINPPLDVTVAGDDPTDMASTVFTLTPKSGLDSAADYTVSFTDGGTDASGAALKHVDDLKVTTMVGPEVIRFRPQDGSRTYDTNQPVSVRFSVPMDKAATAAAFTVTVNGKAISGSKYWAEGDTVLVLTPRYSFKVGQTVVAKVSTAARSAGGIHLDKASTATFTVAKPTSSSVGGGGVATATSPWYPSEVYYFNLMNCTRTGRWVNNSGQCSTVTRHTLPAQPALRLSSTISNKVSRPYAKYMADRKILDHYAYHNPQWRLCNWAKLCGWAYGENIASPSTSGRGGMIAIELFYQNESWCRCEHYYNIMAPFLHQAGVGVWVTKGVVRVSIDFYG